MYEPWEAEERRQIALDRERERYIRGNASCMLCGTLIEDDSCYVLDSDFPMNTAVHKECMEHRFKIMKNAKIEECLIKWLKELLEEKHEANTPNEGE